MRGLVIPMFDGVSFVSPQLELGQVIIKLFFYKISNYTVPCSWLFSWDLNFMVFVLYTKKFEVDTYNFDQSTNFFTP